jgi:polysaccharide biosynthesis/export protein
MKKNIMISILSFLIISAVPLFAFAQNVYRIQAGDILEILTWNEPGFTRSVTVRTDGKVSFPLLDDIQAAGREPFEVKQEIQQKLKGFVNNANVTVLVNVSVPQKFFVLGEVKRTGEYELKKGMTILQAFAVAGGFTEWATKNEIILLRKETGQDTIVRVDYKKIVKGQDLGQNLFIQANDTIVVP